ncbi:MAG: hypothetical protein ACKOC8_01895 [Pirellulales bacterium]
MKAFIDKASDEVVESHATWIESEIARLKQAFDYSAAAPPRPGRIRPSQLRRLLLMIRPARPTLAEVPLADLSFIGRPTTYSMSPITKSLIEELEHAPESVQREVLAFLRHLRARGAGNDGSEDAHALLPLAESAWAADWDTAEEDEAWRNL